MGRCGEARRTSMIARAGFFVLFFFFFKIYQICCRWFDYRWFWVMVFPVMGFGVAGGLKLMGFG